MAELSSELLKTQSVEAMSAAIIKLATTLTLSKHGYTGYVDVKSGKFIVPNAPRLEAEKAEFSGYWNWVLINQKPLVVNKPLYDSLFFDASQKLLLSGYFLSAPALISDKLSVQVSVVGKKEPYNEHDLIILKRIAALYAFAVVRNSKEEELRELNKTLEDRVRQEIESRRQQEQLMIQQSRLAAMGEMIGCIAHQWRQPLNFISATLFDLKSAYKHGDLNESYLVEAIQETKKQLNFMSKTIDDFRNFFKPSKEKTLFNVSETLEEVRTLVFSQLNNANIDLTVTNDNDCSEREKLLIYGYDNEFKQVLINLINNARDSILECQASHEGADYKGHIHIELVCTDTTITLRIQDNGKGIPKELLDKIFDPYFTTKTDGKGTGIGLYMSSVIIQDNMNGKLYTEPSEKGAVFKIELKR
jgi:signal transduction histidine kinase